MIPVEAVEAARDAMQQFALIEDRDGLQSWDAYARLALEAAAPHMLAVAWDEGWDAFAGFDSRPGGPYPANPYRSGNE